MKKTNKPQENIIKENDTVNPNPPKPGPPVK